MVFKLISPRTQKKEILYTSKIVIVGGASVGKTCLFNRFCFNSFNFDSSMTIGLNFHSVNLPIHKKDAIESVPKNKPGFIINSIFDFGGQDRFKPLIPKFLGGADGALLVFDLINPISFEQLEFWYDQLLEHADGSKIPKILVGSKSDLLDSSLKDKIIQEEVIKDFVKEKELDGFFKTSALKNCNVLEVFKELNNMILRYRNTSYVVS